MNATIILSTALAMLLVTNSIKTSSTSEKEFAYNTELNAKNQVVTQSVYRVEGDKYLHQQVKYNYSYNAQNQLEQKEVLKWNTLTAGWEKSYCLNFSYDASGTSITYAQWNAASKAYTEVKEKTIYSCDKETLLPTAYQNYQWEEAFQRWSLVTEHAVSGEESLYAIRD